MSAAKPGRGNAQLAPEVLAPVHAEFLIGAAARAAGQRGSRAEAR